MTDALIISGAQKSASTSVAQWLGGSPGLSAQPRETVAFEGRAHTRRTARLRAEAAAARADGRLLVVKRPEILHNEVVRTRAGAAFPGAVVVTVLRHPVDRAASAWWHYRRMGVLDPGLRLADCVTAWRRDGGATPAGQVVAYSRYAGPVADLSRRFDRPLCFFHHEVTTEPGRTFAPLFDRLGVAPPADPVLPALNSKEAGLQGTRHSRLSGRLTYRWDPRERHLSPRPLGWQLVALARALSLARGRDEGDDAPAVTPEDRAAVAEAVADDLGPLAEALDRPLPAAWDQPAPDRTGGA